MSSSVYPCALTLALACLAAPALASESAPGELTAAESAAVQYLDKSTKPRFPYRLNLGDPQQYAYVMAMLRLAGDSPQKSPQLYRNLEAARKAAKAGPPELAMGEGAGDGGTTLITPINIIQYVYDNGATASSSMVSSVPGGTDNTTMMINFRLSGQSTPFATSPVYKQSAGGTQFIQNFNASLPASLTAAGGANATPVVASSLILTSKGNSTVPYAMSLDDATPNATAVCATAPNYGTQQAPPLSCPPAGAQCVNSGQISTPIKMCYGRNASDCNYAWGGTGYPPSMLMTVAGSMTFPYPVDPSLQGTYILNLQNLNGGCFIPPSSEPTAVSSQYFSIDANNPNKLNFCFPGQALQNAGCLSTVTATALLDFTVYVLVDSPGGGSNYGMGKISSNGAINPNQPWFAQVPQITVFQGCFAAGTQITLPDGSTRKIEQFKGDGSETVLKSADGTAINVAGTGDGVEEKPMIRIVDNAGHSLLITETHAVVTGRGPTLAREVRVGDTVYTQQGPSKVKSISREVYTQKVHHLFLGDMTQAAAGQSTMFANGILVGDMWMQQEAFRKAQERGFSRQDVLGRLPRAWHGDYLNSLRHGTSK
jgi:hypothetical protein